MPDLSFKNFPLHTVTHRETNQGILVKKAHIERIFHFPQQKNTFLLANSEKRNSIFASIRMKTKGYFLEVLFHGLNFNAKRIRLYRAPYFIDVHKSEVYICDEAAANNFKSRVFKRRLIFFSYDQHLLNRIRLKIKEFRLPDTYTGKGLFSRTDQYKIKPGKIRQK